MFFVPLCILSYDLEEDVVHRRYLLSEGVNLNLHAELLDKLIARNPFFCLKEIVLHAQPCIVSYDGERVLFLFCQCLRSIQFVKSCAKPVLDLAHLSLQDHLRVVDERNVVADLLDACHVVRRENDCMTLFLELKDFLLQLFGIDGVEAGERLVKDEEVWVVEHCDDELYFLCHTF